LLGFGGGWRDENGRLVLMYVRGVPVYGVPVHGFLRKGTALSLICVLFALLLAGKLVWKPRYDGMDDVLDVKEDMRIVYCTRLVLYIKHNDIVIWDMEISVSVATGLHAISRDSVPGGPALEFHYRYPHTGVLTPSLGWPQHPSSTTVDAHSSPRTKEAKVTVGLSCSPQCDWS